MLLFLLNQNCVCSLRIFDLPAEAYSGELKSQSATELHDETATDSFAAALQVQEGELVYDYAWYSRMHTSDPVSCCFATTSRVSHCCAYSISTNCRRSQSYLAAALVRDLRVSSILKQPQDDL